MKEKIIGQLSSHYEKKKQEAHGPHRSPEKIVQINKHIWLYNNIN